MAKRISNKYIIVNKQDLDCLTREQKVFFDEIIKHIKWSKETGFVKPIFRYTSYQERNNCLNQEI